MSGGEYRPFVTGRLLSLFECSNSFNTVARQWRSLPRLALHEDEYRPRFEIDVFSPEPTAPLAVIVRMGEYLRTTNTRVREYPNQGSIPDVDPRVRLLVQLSTRSSVVDETHSCLALGWTPELLVRPITSSVLEEIFFCRLSKGKIPVEDTLTHAIGETGSHLLSEVVNDYAILDHASSHLCELPDNWIAEQRLSVTIATAGIH